MIPGEATSPRRGPGGLWSRGTEAVSFLLDKARIHRKPLGSPNPDFRKRRMARVEEVVRLLRYQRAGNSQNHGFSPGDPVITEPLSGRRRRALPPVLWELLRLNHNDERVVKFGWDQDILGQRRVRLKSRQDFQGCQGPGFRGVDDANTRAVPTSSVQPGPLPVESPLRMPLLDDSPCSGHQSGIPCSSRPMRFSTSRAPTPVVPKSSGVSPPRAAWDVVNQPRVSERSPSKSCRARPTKRESRTSRSDSSG